MSRLHYVEHRHPVDLEGAEAVDHDEHRRQPQHAL
ncbi:unnamed protein product [Spirodela intermedia]|uniref:Uncharacterized protein n=1 Tax=Spirodela intermedia TaxID=51605 RepID=A0A7I8K347_SPIIN|nr:unnamed protein product [Spirodela intermedia]